MLSKDRNYKEKFSLDTITKSLFAHDPVINFIIFEIILEKRFDKRR